MEVGKRVKDRYGLEIEVGDSLLYGGCHVLVIKAQKRQVLAESENMEWRNLTKRISRFWITKKNTVVKLTEERKFLMKLESSE